MYGLDASPEMLEKARAYPFKDLVLQNVEEPWRVPGPFDIIVCVGVFDFIREPGPFLAQAYAAMHKGGRGCFGLTFPESGLMAKYSVKRCQALLAQHGFFIERHQRFFGYLDSETGETVHYHGFLLTAH